MTVSDNFLEKAFDANNTDPFLTFLRVNIDGVLYYYANDNQSHVSTITGSSETFQRAAFDLKLPDDTSEGTPTATLSFDAADIQTVRRLRGANSKIILDIWLVLASDVNVIEYGPANYESDNVTIAEGGISIDLSAEPILDIQYPGYRFTPELFPSLWRKPFG